jgi:Protein of unknown function (DUF1674)
MMAPLIECMHAAAFNQALLSDEVLRITLLPFDESAMSEPRASNPSLEPDPGKPPSPDAEAPQAPEEVGGRGGLEPTRYGDWEKNGRCIDF